MSGRSSRSTLTGTKWEFRNSAVAWSSNDSWAITWHQWQAAYPTDNRIGTSRDLASANASSPHSYQSTGLSGVLQQVRRGRVGEPIDHKASLSPPFPPCDLSEPGPVVAGPRSDTSEGPRHLGGTGATRLPTDPSSGSDLRPLTTRVEDRQQLHLLPPESGRRAARRPW